jgi:hypothetical protein
MLFSTGRIDGLVGRPVTMGAAGATPINVMNFSREAGTELRSESGALACGESGLSFVELFIAVLRAPGRRMRALLQ